MTRSTSASALAGLAAAAGAFAMVVAVPPGQARPLTMIVQPSPDHTRTVSFADLNLATAAGEKTFRGRVHKAVRMLCRRSEQSAAENRAGQACRNFAWRGATPQIAKAVKRAREIAEAGTSSIRVSAIRIRAPY